MKLKICTKCHRSKCFEQFTKDKTKKDGFYPSCKGCYRARLGWRKRNPIMKVRRGISFFRCTKCKKLKLTDKFYQNLSRKNHLHNECKICSINRSKTDIAIIGRRGRQQREKMEVLSHYSNGKPICKCCGESIFEFLCIDHINGGGKEHRKQVGNGHFYRWLRKNNYPKGLQVLCHNCNMAKGFYGFCPHRR